MMHEHPKRSIAKTASWRSIALVLNGVIVYVATHDLALALGFGAGITVVHLFFQYFHERTWDRTEWGIEYHDPLPRK